MKFFGLIMIFFSGIILVFLIKNKSDKRIKLLEEFIKNLDFMYTGISFYKMPLREIFEKLYIICDSDLKDIYKKTINRYERNSFGEIINKSEIGFNNKDKIIIRDFSDKLGNTDYESQLKNISVCREYLCSELKSEMESVNKNQKTQTTLVISGVLVIMILII